MLSSIFPKIIALVAAGFLIFYVTTTPPKTSVPNQTLGQVKSQDQLASVGSLSDDTKTPAIPDMENEPEIIVGQMNETFPSSDISFDLASFIPRIDYLKDEIGKLTAQKNLNQTAPFTIRYTGMNSGASGFTYYNNSASKEEDNTTNETGTSSDQTGTTTNATSTIATSTNATSTNATSTNATSTNATSTIPSIANGGFVSINFDDGEISAFDIGRPIMLSAGLPATFYITTHQLGTPDFSGYMTASQVLQLQTDGFEVGNHTQSHANLITLATSSIQQEITGANQDLAQMGITNVSSIAYPSGHTNSAIETLVSGSGLIGGRGASNLILPNQKTTDPFDLYAFAPDSSSSWDQIQSGIDQAISSHGWFIITFHSFNKAGDNYSVSPTLLQQTVDYLKLHNIPVATNDRGLREFMGR